MFENFQVTEQDVIVEKIYGRLTGMGLVRLGSPQRVHQAMKELDRYRMGSRYIEVMEPDMNKYM